MGSDQYRPSSAFGVKSGVGRVSYDASRRLGTVSRWAHDKLSSVGRFVGKASSLWPKYPRPVKHLQEKDNPASARDTIRAMILEELSRLHPAQENQSEQDKLPLDEFERRLQLMSSMIEALKDRIGRLSASGPISKAVVMKELYAMPAAESLSGDEKALLAGIFRQNIAIQKPELAGKKAGDALSA